MFMHDQEPQETDDPPVYSETVLATPNEQNIMACSLVLSAVGISHKIANLPHNTTLQVSTEDLHAAGFQIQG